MTHPQALITFRHPTKAICLPETFPAWRIVDQRRYGDMMITLMTARQENLPNPVSSEYPETDV